MAGFVGGTYLCRSFRIKRNFLTSFLFFNFIYIFIF